MPSQKSTRVMYTLQRSSAILCLFLLRWHRQWVKLPKTFHSSSSLIYFILKRFNVKNRRHYSHWSIFSFLIVLNIATVRRFISLLQNSQFVISWCVFILSLSQIVGIISVFFICVSIVSFCLKTHPDMRVPVIRNITVKTANQGTAWVLDKTQTNAHEFFFYIECFCNGWFTFEILVSCCCCCWKLNLLWACNSHCSRSRLCALCNESSWHAKWFKFRMEFMHTTLVDSPTPPELHSLQSRDRRAL